MPRNRAAVSISASLVSNSSAMLREMAAAPTTSPSGFRMGDIEMETSMMRLSLVSRTVSKALTARPFRIVSSCWRVSSSMLSGASTLTFLPMISSAG